MKPDFSGYATRNNVKCADGRTIMPGSFEHQDKERVPLVWQHLYDTPSNILGHGILEHREDGVYVYGFLNNTDQANDARKLLEHGDIDSLSIRAARIREKNKQVFHGTIQEVSLVLSGANPGAYIDNVSIQHGDSVTTLEDEVIIYTDLKLEHGDDKTGENVGTKTLTHKEDEKTVKDVYESFDDEQKKVVHYLISEALEAEDEEEDEEDVEHGSLDEDDKKGSGTMTHNIFENGATVKERLPELTHSDMKGIFEDAQRVGSFKEAVENYAFEHGITNIELLFPEARNVRQTPDLVKRDTGWVSGVINGAHKTPFSRIKSTSADLTVETARALGYVKGNVKKEEFFAVARRITTPQTIYKKQKLDRDDIVDIVDFDVVSWIRSEMRLMLEEELARAILIGDGREVDDDDKIQEGHIRPVATDDTFYAHQATMPEGTTGDAVVDFIVRNRRHYKGSGSPTFYTTEENLTEMLLIKDAEGRRIYRTEQELASALRVSNIVPVEVMEGAGQPFGILLNISDYTIGADRGGQVTHFDDFDIDYNQYKYLIETRVSGALTKPKSAVVINTSTGTPGNPED